MSTSAGGLEAVVAAQSAITAIDGQQGELWYRGYAIGDLAEHATFEQVAYLLWYGELPTEDQLQTLCEDLQQERAEAKRFIDLVSTLPTTAHPLDVLRFLVSWDALENPDTWDNTPGANRKKALLFTAWFPIAVAAYHRRRAGLEPIQPPAHGNTAQAFLRMLYGTEPSPLAVQTMQTSLVLHADHELNASTFAARVTIATQSNLHAAVASALGTLSGPRHGGASDRVIKMLIEIGNPKNTESWVHDQLAQKRRIMGFGHRVYRTVDPRSRHLRVMAERMLEGTDHAGWSDILRQLSVIMQREKNLYPNVDLYAAVVNHELGIDPAFYTSIFAVSRITGWTAHAIEQLDGRMIRPMAEYTGPPPRSMRGEVVGAR